MISILQEAFALENLVATVILILCAAYWIFVIFGFIDLEALDFTPDVDFELDMDVEGGVDGEPAGEGSESSPGWLASAMKFFNMSQVPGIVVLSIASLVMWILVLNLNYFLNPNGIALLGIAFVLPSMIAGLFVGKWATTPLKPLFERLNQGETHLDVIGQEAIVKSGVVDAQFGQVVVDKEGAPLLLNARVATGEESIPKGARVIIFQRDQETGDVMVRRLGPAEPPS